jgi:hypothetical protein
MKNFLPRDQSAARLLLTRMLAVFVLMGGLFTSLPAASADAPVLLITRPSHEETIHDNLGDVSVVVTLQGTQLATGRHLRVLLDGKSYGQKIHTPSFTIGHVDRGQHTLSVELVDESNAVIAASPTITFHLWQASRLLPIR